MNTECVFAWAKVPFFAWARRFKTWAQNFCLVHVYIEKQQKSSAVECKNAFCVKGLFFFYWLYWKRIIQFAFFFFFKQASGKSPSDLGTSLNCFVSPYWIIISHLILLLHVLYHYCTWQYTVGRQTHQSTFLCSGWYCGLCSR